MKHLNASIKFSLVVLSLAFAQVAAADTLIDTWSSIRAQGMGGAYTAVVDDADALFYNPAGLAKTGGFEWTVIDPRLGANGFRRYRRASSGYQFR